MSPKSLLNPVIRHSPPWLSQLSNLMKSSFFTVERASVAELDLFTVKSNALNHRADVSVYKPEGNYKNMPVVILLHGVYGSHWAWSLKANVHKILQQLIDDEKVPPMMLVMPSDGLFQDGSGYLPHQAVDYEKWIVEDVPLLIKESYGNVSEKSLFFRVAPNLFALFEKISQ